MKLVKAFKKHRRDHVRVSLGTYHDRALVHMRIHSTANGRHLGKGITLRVEQISELISALGAAEREAHAAGDLQFDWPDRLDFSISPRSGDR